MHSHFSPLPADPRPPRPRPLYAESGLEPPPWADGTPDLAAYRLGTEDPGGDDAGSGASGGGSTDPFLLVALIQSFLSLFWRQIK